MGKRIQKQLDLPSDQVGPLVILSISFLAGGVIGCLFVGAAGDSGAEALRNYLVDYLALARTQIISREFWPILWHHIRFFVLLVLLGVTLFGLFGIPLLLFVRGFFLSFSIACFWRVFGGYGLLPALVFFGVPALLWTPALFLIGTKGLVWGRGVVHSRMSEGFGMAGIGVAYWRRVGFGCLLVLSCVFWEYKIVPMLLRAVSHILL